MNRRSTARTAPARRRARDRRHLPIAAGIGVLAAGLAAAPGHAARPQSVEDLSRLSLEELGNLEITSVSRRPEPLSRAPAAIYVITGDEIRRSGATSLPEALRLAPNLNVAQRDAITYAISARGFNGAESANKLLVLIDGRSVYTPLHGGVFWDAQNVLLDDIDRIEVVSGPGGTLWGANAVNGVINVVTKSATATQGGLVTSALGTRDRSVAARYGGAIGDSGAWRAYALGFDRGETAAPGGGGRDDDWDGKQTGFRADWQAAASAFTLQGDLYDSGFEAGGGLSGGNLLGRWTRGLGGGAELQAQAYYDRAERSAPGVADELETVDLAAQHLMPAGTRHEIVWGGGLRFTHDRFVNETNAFVLDPPSRTVRIGNVFVQDGVALHEDVTLTLGAKLEHSSYTGAEFLPSARLAWQVSERTLLWSAVSRAVRTPSRIDRELIAPGVLDPAPDFDSEKLIAYELGYRGRPVDDVTLSVSLFYNQYDDLRTTEPAPGTILPLRLGNGMEGDTYGAEIWGDWDVLPWWRLSAGLSLLHKDLRLKPGSADISDMAAAGNDPDRQAMLRSSMDLADDLLLDVGLRAVDALDDPAVPGYVAFDARLAWQPTEALELSVAGFNLFDDRHPEAGDPAIRGEIRRGVHLGLRWQF